MGYGVRLRAGVLTPYGATTVGPGTRRLRAGSRLTLGSGLAVSLEGQQQTQAGAEPSHGVQVQADWAF